MNTKRLAGLFFAVFLFCLNILAQTSAPTPIKWRMTVKMTSPSEGTVTLRAVVDEGWHLYGTELPKDGPIPTTFNFTESRGVKFTDNFKPSVAPGNHADPNFGMSLNWWEGNVTFTRHFRLTGDISQAVIIGTVRFMGCNDANCLPPKSVSFKASPKPFNVSK